MRHPLIILAAVLAAGGATAAQQKSASGAGIVRAHADVKGEGITGTAEFVEKSAGRRQDRHDHVTLAGLKAKGMHGVHLHAVGSEAPFTSAGGHFDPGPPAIPTPTPIICTWATSRRSRRARTARGQ